MRAVCFPKEWITDDLVTKIRKNPKVSEWLQNPQKASFLGELQNNPKVLLDLQNRKDDADVMKQIAGILGNRGSLYS